MTRRCIVVSLAIGMVLAAHLVAVTAARVTVTTSPTLIYTSATGGSTVLVRNAGTASVYLGAAAVATTTGFELLAGDSVSLPMSPNESVYGIVASSTVIVHALETRR